MNPDSVMYEMFDGYVTMSSVDAQHEWMNRYRIDAIRMGRMCEKFPALQKSWDDFKLIYEICRSQDDIDRQTHN